MNLQKPAHSPFSLRLDSVRAESWITLKQGMQVLEPSYVEPGAREVKPRLAAPAECLSRPVRFPQFVGRCEHTVRALCCFRTGPESTNDDRRFDASSEIFKGSIPRQQMPIPQKC
jgi:hypothetical protein